MKYLLIALSLSLFQLGFSQKVNEEKIKFTDTRLPLKPIKTIKSYNFTVVSPYPENNNSVKEFAQKKYQEEMANYPNVVAESERKYDDQLKKHEEDVATARENFRIENEAFDKMTLLERMAMKDQKPVLRLPSKPTYYKPSEPRYVEPDLTRSITFDTKMLSTMYLKLHGYEKGTEQALVGKVTIYNFEYTEPERKSREYNVYDKASGRTIPKVDYYYVATYRRTVEVSLEHNGEGIYSGILESSTEYKKYEGPNPPNMLAIEKKSVEDALVIANDFINNNYGYSPIEVNREVSFVKNKDGEYDDLEKAKGFAVSGYASLKRDVKNTDLEDAIAIWVKALGESDLEDKKARIDEKVTRVLLVNTIDAAITVNDFKTAETQIKAYEALKNSNSEKKMIEALRAQYADKKMRFEAAM